MTTDTLYGVYRMFWFDLIFPTIFSYIMVEIIFHLISDAIRGRQ